MLCARRHVVTPGRMVAALLLASLASAVTLPAAQGQPCTPEWSNRFFPPTTVGTVEALCVYDDGRGPAVYAGGSFAIGGHPDAPFNLARWDGQTWTRVGGGVDGTVHALAVFDDGRGPALYVGGAFHTAGGVPAENLARWDGSSWSPVGEGCPGYVWLLKAIDVGTGPALYVGHGLAVYSVRRWNGAVWFDLPSTYVGDLAVFDAGDGPRLYGALSDALGRLDGDTWTTVQTLHTSSGGPRALAVFDDGGGPALYVGGAFKDVVIGSEQVTYLARWDGTHWAGDGIGASQWSDLELSLRGVRDLEVAEENGQQVLYAGGGFKWRVPGGLIFDRAYCVVRRDNIGWHALCEFPCLGCSCPQWDGAVRALTTLNAASGHELFVGGPFATADGQAIAGVARYANATWSAPVLANPLAGGLGGRVGYLLAAFPGDVVQPQNLLALSSRRHWNGPASPAAWLTRGGWEPFGDLPDEINNERAVTAAKDPNGWAIFVVDSGTGNRVTRWQDGTPQLIGTANSPTQDWVVHDRGNGPEAYLIGDFTTINGQPSAYAARWNGSGWDAVQPTPDGRISYAASFDDGALTRLYTMGGSPAALSAWDGNTWEVFDRPLGSFGAMLGFDDGGGPALFTIGSVLSTSTLLVTTYVWRFRDAAWTLIGSSESHPSYYGAASKGALAVLDDGTGSRLYAVGSWQTMDGVAAPGIARWDGTHWEAVGTGLNIGMSQLGGKLAVVDEDGAGANPPALYVGGDFFGAGGMAATGLARWGCRPRYPGDVNCDGHNTFADIDPFVTALGGAAAYAEHFPLCNWLNADCNDDGQVTFADIDPFVGLLGQ